MTPETRRRVIRYGIALDLVILATGVGLLLPGHPYVLLCTFIGACALASWKGGWAGGGAAIAASLLAIFSSFWGAEIDAQLLVAFVIGSVASVAAIRAALMPRAPRVALRAFRHGGARPRSRYPPRDDAARPARRAAGAGGRADAGAGRRVRP